MYEIKMVNINNILVDYSYQRKPSAKTIASDFAVWNPDVLIPLIVGKRSNGALYVIDGLRRKTGAEIHGIKQLPCKILTSSGPVYEAALFVGINSNGEHGRRPLSAVQIHQGSLAAMDETAIRVSEILGDLGLSMRASGWEENNIHCIAWLSARVKEGKPVKEAIRTAMTIVPDMAGWHTRARGKAFTFTTSAQFLAAVMWSMDHVAEWDNVKGRLSGKLTMLRLASDEAKARGASGVDANITAIMKAINHGRKKKAVLRDAG